MSGIREGALKLFLLLFFQPWVDSSGCGLVLNPGQDGHWHIQTEVFSLSLSHSHTHTHILPLSLRHSLTLLSSDSQIVWSLNKERHYGAQVKPTSHLPAELREFPLVPELPESDWHGPCPTRASEPVTWASGL